MDRILDYLHKCGAFYLATMDSDGPQVRPFGSVCIFEDKIYICMGNYKAVFKQITADPRICIVAYDGADTWIRINAKAVLDQRQEARDAMIAAEPSLTDIYDMEADEFEVFYLTDMNATFYEGDVTEEIEF
ncbi:MAG: hypothetical protein GX222_07940 [Ruminococcaceae bacterium]|nr:hypothetical protein [Oscillospiraceae bacterium]